MSREDGMEQIKAFMKLMQVEGNKISAAECMVEAKTKELEAAIYMGDWQTVEVARYATVTAFEAFLDTRIAAVRRAKDAQADLP